MNAPLHPVGLSLKALYDPAEESVGVEIDPSDDFGAEAHMRESIEILAALTAQANFLAAELIQQWDEEEPRKRALYEHFAALKEGLLDRIIQETDQNPDS